MTGPASNVINNIAQTWIAKGFVLIENLLQLEVHRLQVTGQSPGHDDYRGLYISDEDAEKLVTPPPLEGKEADIYLLEKGFNLAWKKLRNFHEEADGRLKSLIEWAGLDWFETGTILLCIASEIDLRFERLYAYVQDDVTRKAPRVDLAIRLLTKPDQYLKARNYFEADAPLMKYRLLHVYKENNGMSSFLGSSIYIDSGMANYLLGQKGIDEFFARHTEIISMAQNFDFPLGKELEQQLAGLLSYSIIKLDEPIVQIVGKDEKYNVLIAQRLLEMGTALLSVDFPNLAGQLGVEGAYALCQREAGLHNQALFLKRLHALESKDYDQLCRLLKKWNKAPAVFMSIGEPYPWDGIRVVVPEATFTVRRQYWGMALGDQAKDLESEDLDTLADKFRLPPGEIDRAVRAARSTILLRDPTAGNITLADLYSAARSQSTPILSSLARKITPQHAWKDIVLPDDTLQQLTEMCAYVEHRHIVYEKWGFDRKFATGKGLMALFSGPSGTGKTMAADILAGELGLDFYKIDLSGLVSKYIGETEKNLNQIFSEAETSNAILFFDEADALFGKRSEVKDAHDRYANIETAYLLQKMEDYSGVVILATNMKMNIDEAFIRRMHFVVDFPMPNETDRLRIWKTLIPQSVPLAQGVDFSRLARRYKLSGGNIRNIVLSAAFLAAADGQMLTMKHLLWACRREFQKMGRLINPSDYEQEITGEKPEPGTDEVR